MAIHYYEDYDESWYQNDYKEVKISDDGLKLIGVPVTSATSILFSHSFILCFRFMICIISSNNSII